MLGIDPRQYSLLLDLFSLLSDRMEFMGTTVGLNRAAGWYFAMSLFFSVGAFIIPSLSGYLFLMIGYSMLFMLCVLWMDAGNSILNPDEASVLAHQPISGATYVAAKLTHLLSLVVILIPALNLVPAVAGLYLRESRWFYPLTHLMAAYVAGLFVAFFVCAIYGWCFRYIAPAKLKNAALWLQLVVFPLMAIGNTILMHANSAPVVARRVLGSSWMPWRWFVALGLAGQAQYAGFSAWEAGAACLFTAAFIALGLRAFKADYLINVSTLIQGSAASVVRRPQVSWLNPLVRSITGSPSGYGAFSFVNTMLLRDWNLRRQALPLVAIYFGSPLFLVIGNIRNSPFFSGDFTLKNFSLMHILPHLLGIGLAVLCPLLSYTAEPVGASMFVPLPLGRLRPFVGGVCLSLWVPMGIIHLLLLGPCIWFWGAVQGILFVGFSLALVSLYLSLAVLLVDGFPFANAFRPSSGAELPVLMLGGMVPALIFGIFQWIIFRNTLLVLAAAVVLALLSAAVSRSSLGRFEKKARANLAVMGFGPQKMFKELE